MPFSLDDAILSVLDKKTWKRFLEIFDEVKGFQGEEFETLKLERLNAALDTLVLEGFILRKFAPFSQVEHAGDRGRSAYEYLLAGERVKRVA